jgi:drug/metabolite transporter (DMT)-like permease
MRARLITRVSDDKTKALLALQLLLAVFLWGAGNTGTKVVLGSWPPVWTGASRFLAAGAVLWVILKFTSILGRPSVMSREVRRDLWLRGGLSLAVYIVVFNWAVRLTHISHVALYLGAAPVWALLWEGRPAWNRETALKYGAAGLALAGVAVLFWPALNRAETHWVGEVLGLSASVLWTQYGRQCRALGATLTGPEVSGHTMWRAGALLMPLALLEIWGGGVPVNAKLLLIHGYCILGAGVAAFALWSNALRHWPASKVLLFNNLIPLSTTIWAWFCLREPLTPTFWGAMGLIVAGVVLGQTNWQKILAPRQVPPE